EEFINRIISTLREQLQAVEITAELQGRPKHLYSIYNKIKEQHKQFNEIYDLTGIRVIVSSVKDCYGALGVVHSLWRPIPGRFKDYIAMPKPNMYQSLHTTVVGAENELVEIQIRTWEMHHTAEYGIAAHWRYKEKIKNPRELDEKLAWLRQLLEWQHEYRDPREFMESLKIDLFSDEVFLFTPRGDVINLPKGSSPLDFAYKIHTDIGHRCTGARANGRIVPLDYLLKTGEMVEIITGKQSSPSRDWLKIVKTPQAKNRIRSWFKKERREENIEKGRELLEREFKKLNLDHHLFLKSELLEEVGRKFNLFSAEDVYAMVGYGGVTALQITGRLKEEYTKRYGEEEPPVLETRPAKQDLYPELGVKIQGADNLLLRIARCCSPVPGDKITGFITRGRGVSIHRSGCPNLKHAQVERLIEATWDKGVRVTYPVGVEVRAIDRPNLLAEVVALVSESRVNILAVDGKADKDRIAVIHLTIMVQDRTQLIHITNRIRRIRDVLSVSRYPVGR
ncbi:MAG TPA: bifunctional (p)ppGpp synthetase/guanosine-3',5'-bis(diphosphate) 3'-pyrophosphohydrolase, partial [Firmicutes bacterium]|nr:bifunctional (p)ppGpp synthetase/guanosine-3',5'-bis(diphosphate) 3'-pyrophosphohydrolase [Bacillota bacterium]